MSLYPTASTWSSYNTQCLANMKDMVTRYGIQVMLCEVGMPENDPATAEAFLKDISPKPSLCPAGWGYFIGSRRPIIAGRAMG